MTFEPKPFGKYFLVEKIAVGGMAEIYKAKTFGVDGFEKLLAIKKILPHYSADKEFIAMLTDEAKLVVRLSHTNIVQIYDLGKVGDDYYISMEYIEGVNLREVITRAKEVKETIPLPICFYIASEMCKGLDYAHGKRDDGGEPLHIVHRDISPQNILLSFEGETKIVDFGIAKAAMNVSHTTAGILKGKITYMSPEQAIGKPVDGRTDVFSTALLLYEMITGERFFNGETQLEVLNKIRDTKITVANFDSRIPDEVKPILAKALNYNPNDRYETAGDFQIALTKLLYSRYVDFSPKKLASLIKKWFSEELKKKRSLLSEEASYKSLMQSIGSEPGGETSLVKSNEPDTGEVILSDTAKPGDNLKPEMFASTPKKRGKPPSPKKNYKRDDELTITSASKIRKIESAGKKSKSRLFLALGILVILGIGIFTLTSPPKKEVGETANIQITSVPDGASVYVNGEDTGEVTPAALEKNKAPADYLVRLELDGYEPFEQKVSLKPGEPSIVHAKLNPNTAGSLVMNSKPEGAKISIDGKNAGISPLTVKGLDMNKPHKLLVEKEGYEPFEKDVELNDIDATQVFAELIEKTPLGSLNIKSNPSGAIILINDKSTGLTTPAQITDLTLGQTYKIVLQKDAFEKFGQEIVLDKKDPYLIEANLIPQVVTAPIVLKEETFKEEVVVEKKVEKKTEEKKEKPKEVRSEIPKEMKIPPPPPSNSYYSGSGVVRIDSSPRGASVLFDGSKAGSTPVLIPNVEGSRSHTITLSLPGYRNWTRTFTLGQSRMEMTAQMER